MRKAIYFTLLFAAGLAIFGLLGSSAKPVFAESVVNSPSRITTKITFTKPDDVTVGEPFVLTGLLKDQFDRPIADKPIIFTIDKNIIGQARTDAKGFFQREFENELSAGTYSIAATYKGAYLLSGTTESTTLNVLSSVVQIQTVPPISGVTFQMNGEEFVSDVNGNASLKVNKPGLYRLDILADKYHNPLQKIEFDRWLEESYEPFREVRVPNENVIQVGFNIFHQVSQKFVDLDGNPVDPKRVEKFSIRSAQGDVFNFPNGSPRWIPASRIARRVTGLEETKLLYSVINVTVDGSNVVNQSQQRFYTHPNETWPISLLLYSLHINAKDGLFGSAVGKSVNLEFPDGKIVNYPLNQNGMTDIYSLARGNYFVELEGTNGMSNRMPVALSRNQEVSAKVITYLDMAVVGFIGAVFAIGLLLYGRPGLMHGFKRNKQMIFEETVLELKALPDSEVLVQENLEVEGIAVEIPETSTADAEVVITSPTMNDHEFMTYDSIKMLSNEDFEKSTGISRDMFENMVILLQKELPKVGRSPKLSLQDQLMLTLMYLREHNNVSEISLAYGVSKKTVRYTVQKINSALMKSDEFHLPVSKETFQTPGEITEEVILIDTPEIQTDELSKDNKEAEKTAKRNNKRRKNSKS